MEDSWEGDVGGSKRRSGMYSWLVHSFKLLWVRIIIATEKCHIIKEETKTHKKRHPSESLQKNTTRYLEVLFFVVFSLSLSHASGMHVQRFDRCSHWRGRISWGKVFSQVWVVHMKGIPRSSEILLGEW